MPASTAMHAKDPVQSCAAMVTPHIVLLALGLIRLGAIHVVILFVVVSVLLSLHF